MKKLSAMLAFALLIPAMVHAMTIADVTRLSQSGVGDEVVLSQIDASKQIFTLTVDDILELKNAGVSDRVITYMINTGKHQQDAAPVAGEQQPAQAADAAGDGSLDEYYQGYHDASANLYLSWGWGGYYSGGWGSYWPGYYGYYYPSYWCGSYYSYPYYCYNDYYGSYYAYNDGRNVYGRGGSGASYQRSSKGSGQPGSAVSQNPRQYKSGSPAYGNRGSTTGRSGKSGNSGNVSNPSGTQSGRTSKPSTYNKNSSSNRQAPAPSVGPSRGYGGGSHSAPSGGGGGGRGSAPSGGGGGRTSKGR